MFTKNRTILILGILTALMPFLGFPYPYEEGLYIVFGLIIAVLSFLIARQKRINRKVSGKKTQKVAEDFLPESIVPKEIVESVPFAEEELVLPETEEISRQEMFGAEENSKDEEDKPYIT